MAPRSPPLNYVSANGTFMVRNGEYIYASDAANPYFTFCPSFDIPVYPSRYNAAQSRSKMDKVIVALKKPFRTKKQRLRDRLDKATNKINDSLYQGASGAAKPRSKMGKVVEALKRLFRIRPKKQRKQDGLKESIKTFKEVLYRGMYCG